MATTPKTERHKRAATSKARFYAGPAESHRDPTTQPSSAAAGDVWTRTPEEVEEERLLQLSFPGAYGDQEQPGGGGGGAHDDTRGRDGGAEARAATAATTGPSLQSVLSSAASLPAAAVGVSPSPPLPPPPPAAGRASVTSAVAGSTGDVSATAEERLAAAGDGRRRKDAGQQKPGVFAGAANAVRRWGRGESVVGEESGEGSSPVVSTAALEGENRDLVARLKNELDDARLVENKMSEVSRAAGFSLFSLQAFGKEF